MVGDVELSIPHKAKQYTAINVARPARPLSRLNPSGLMTPVPYAYATSCFADLWSASTIALPEQ